MRVPDVGKGSWASSSGTARSMRGNKRRDTQPEIKIRKLLHASGLRFRIDYSLQPGIRTKADIVFTRRRVAVYIDGCFWHGCPQHATYPKTNTEHWLPKLARNIERDRKTDAALQACGWTVIRIWEHVLPSDAAVLIARAVASSPAASDEVSTSKHAP